MDEEVQASGGTASSKPIRKPAALAPGLHIVATPIGNMGDITLRAIDVLRAADVIACEDTRVFAKLATHHGISAPTVAYSDATQDSAGPRLMRALAEGKRVALVSDAGMPLISDPGYRLVRDALAALHARAERPNLLIKIPGTTEGLPAIEQSIFDGFFTPAALACGSMPVASTATAVATATMERLIFDPPVRIGK